MGMKFLIQNKYDKNHGFIPVFDWQIELINNINYQNKTRNEENQIDYFPSNTPTVDNVKNYIPVGSVEFVHEFFEYNNIPIPDPVNIPEELFELSEMKPQIHSFEEKLKKKRYIKSCDMVKHPENGLSDYIPFGIWQSTKNIKEGFDAEFRCFIFNGQLLDIKPYIGKWWNINLSSLEHYIKQCIFHYKSAPPSYTLDIGIQLNENGYNLEDQRNNFYIIEVHNFYSCGLYGFSMPHLYPQMLSQWYCWWLRKNGINNND